MKRFLLGLGRFLLGLSIIAIIFVATGYADKILHLQGLIGFAFYFAAFVTTMLFAKHWR
jgi:hypothetical protein